MITQEPESAIAFQNKCNNKQLIDGNWYVGQSMGILSGETKQPTWPSAQSSLA